LCYRANVNLQDRWKRTVRSPTYLFLIYVLN
jgi:hypothetical protein